jgi:Mrp family chromosome partitioning ATPase
VTLGKAGYKTLLIEGDLHRPTLASLFGFGELRGLSHWWLSQKDEIATFLHRVNDMPLWLLTAGKPYEHPADILQSSQFAEAFVQLAGWFQWVVVDSTPMQPTVDANLWSRLVDGALLVVREGLTPVKALKIGLRAIDDPKFVGVVMNEASECDHASYEGNYYPALKEKS